MMSSKRAAARSCRRTATPAGLSVLLLMALALLLAAPSASVAQGEPTNTPDAEGNIRVVVQPDDSLWSIAARAGLTIPELLALNGLAENVVLRPGDTLIVSAGPPPATPTSDVPTPTLPPPTVTATIARPRTAVCFLAYDDRNRDGNYDPAEPLRAQVAFTVFNEQDVVSNYVTDGVSEPYCLEDLAPGVYHVTRSRQRDETLTTEGDWALNLALGSVLNLAFGSYTAAAQPAPNQEEQLQTRLAGEPAATPTLPVPASGAADPWPVNPRLAIAGFVLLLALAVLTLLFASQRNARS